MHKGLIRKQMSSGNIENGLFIVDRMDTGGGVILPSCLVPDKDGCNSENIDNCIMAGNYHLS